MRAAVLFLFPAFTFTLCSGLLAQSPRGAGEPGDPILRQGVRFDLEGKGSEARDAFQKAIDAAPTPAAKAAAQRAMAMSWAFEVNCKKTVEYEDMVIAYWKTQENASPENAFYQQGEMADEAARVCIDGGHLQTAYDLYKKGRNLGLREPNISPARKDLWDYRWEHAQARIAARRGNKSEADQHVRAAKSVLEDMKQRDQKLYEQQSRFLPYLTGYVAYYTGDYHAALTDLQKANTSDPFIQCLLGMTYEKLGDRSNARQAYEKAMNTHAHNPPAAFAIPFARKKLKES
jgi:tetratricopeptide (TPR) repeat protein